MSQMRCILEFSTSGKLCSGTSSMYVYVSVCKCVCICIVLCRIPFVPRETWSGIWYKRVLLHFSTIFCTGNNWGIWNYMRLSTLSDVDGWEVWAEFGRLNFFGFGVVFAKNRERVFKYKFIYCVFIFTLKLSPIFPSDLSKSEWKLCEWLK